MAEEQQEETTSAATKLQKYLKDQEALLTIDEANLNEDFVNQAPRYFKAAMNFHKAERAVQLEKQELEKLVAIKDSELRSTGEKTTEAYIDKAIKGDEDVQAQKKRIIDAELQVGLHQACMRSWDHKRDMLIQVGAVQRAEMQGQTQLNKSHPDQDAAPKTKNGRPTAL